MKYTYASSIPDCILPELKSKFEPFIDLWPGWLQEIIIHYPNNDLKSALTCEPDFKYRLAHINVYDEFLREKDWELMVLHEMFHVYWSPYTSHIEAIVDGFIKDEDLLAYLLGQLAAAEEGVTQDFAKMAEKLYLTKYKKSGIIPNNEQKESD